MLTITAPRPPVKTTHKPYTQPDLDWAARAFGDIDTDRSCALCGADAEHGLCGACERLADEASVACRNYAATGDYRSF
jgi:hypothetical protein